ncbi:MAG TPA: TetR/AcrR family transcriptional regulator [Polyangiaceae bacterium]|nr:TetR/AcrR family transcriptional regulator [Polyangiaceae bacterium]
MDATARRQREKLERRYQIMDAAERVFLQTGVEHATMDHIARAANVSKGSLYLCFKDRDDLYLSIAQRAIDDLIEREEAVQEQMASASGYEWFEAGLRCYVRYALEYQNRFRVAMSWLFAEEPLDERSPAYIDYQLGVSRAFQFGIEALELGKLDGSVRAELESSQTVFSLWGGLVGLLLMLSNVEEARRRIPFEVDYEGALESHLCVVLQSIRALVFPAVEQSGLRVVDRQRISGG